MHEQTIRRESPGALHAWMLVLFAGVIVLALACPSLHVTRTIGRVSALWPVNAVLLALMLRSPRPLWPALLAAGLAGNIGANLLCGDHMLQAVAIASCNSVETGLCAYGLARFAGAEIDLGRQRDLTAFSILSVAAPVVSASMAAAYLGLSGVQLPLPSFGAWLLADALGLFILTPALLLLSDRKGQAEALQALKTGSKLPLALLGLLLFASVFGPWHSAFLLAPPLLVLITLEYQMAGAAAAMLSITLVCVGLALSGHPAQFWGTPTEQLLKLQGFLAVTAAVILPLGSVVTQRTGWRIALAEARDRAEAAAAAKSDFLANMSHELRTPLTSIIGFAGLLRDDAEINPRQARYVSRINDASQALLAVINDVLDFSKLEAGELELDQQPTSPDHLIRETAGLISLQAEAKGLKLIVQSGGLPGAVMVDQGRLRQVLLNLLSNAVKFTAAGSVTVTAEHSGGRLRVAVADTGEGVAPDRLDRLFQRFSQADSSISRQFGGTGLGLAICRSLVELMDGAIQVETRLGEGSTFTFEVAAPVAASADEAGAAGAELHSLAERRILLVDDASPNRELVRAILEPIGLAVVEAHDGAAAIEAAAGERFDLILMDVRMPGVDGLAATRRIRAGDGPNRTTPIVGLSADVQQADIEACRLAGMNDHVAKPIAVPDLIGKTLHWITPQAASDSADQVPPPRMSRPAMGAV